MKLQDTLYVHNNHTTEISVEVYCILLFVSLCLLCSEDVWWVRVILKHSHFFEYQKLSCHLGIHKASELQLVLKKDIARLKDKNWELPSNLIIPQTFLNNQNFLIVMG
jgi:hypothetical protein